MAVILDGKKVADEIIASVKGDVLRLAKRNITPALAIIRMGERAGDISYERGAVRRCESAGVAVKCFTLPEDASQDALLSMIKTVNEDKSTHGCLLLRPFPAHIDDCAARNALAPEKDVDGITNDSLAGVFAGAGAGFPPCTPRACIEILERYCIEAAGKRAVVIGRSLVAGKPAAMMLLQKNATVTVCHTKTDNMTEICREADILLVAAGKAKVIGGEYFSEKQIVIDVGINMDEDGRLCGDVDFAEAERVVKAITPVPGGVGAVTSSILAKHTLEAAKRAGEGVK